MSSVTLIYDIHGPLPARCFDAAPCRGSGDFNACSGASF